MNTNHLRYLCSHHALGAPTSAPTKVLGGFHHKMWRVETERGTYAIKELSPDADLNNEDMVRGYNVSEAIAETFARVGIAAIVALKAGLLRWFARYNSWRPHGAHGNRTPQAVYQTRPPAPKAGVTQLSEAA